MRLVQQDHCQINTSLTTLSITHECRQTHTNTEFTTDSKHKHTLIYVLHQGVYTRRPIMSSPPTPQHFHSTWQSGCGAYIHFPHKV
jgi:hypothetical protein